MQYVDKVVATLSWCSVYLPLIHRVTLARRKNFPVTSAFVGPSLINNYLFYNGTFFYKTLVLPHKNNNSVSKLCILFIFLELF